MIAASLETEVPGTVERRSLTIPFDTGNNSRDEGGRRKDEGTSTNVTPPGNI